jgi:hypothetical protein
LDTQLTGHPPAGGVPTVPSTAVIASVSPTIITADAGETATEFTHGNGPTVTTAVPVFPSAVAVTAADPSARAFTAPSLPTEITDVSVDCQATDQPPVGGVPVVLSEAVSLPESPSVSAIVEGASVIAVTEPVAVVPLPPVVAPPPPGGGPPELWAPVTEPGPSPPQEMKRTSPATITAATRRRRDRRDEEKAEWWRPAMSGRAEDRSALDERLGALNHTPTARLGKSALREATQLRRPECIHGAPVSPEPRE